MSTTVSKTRTNYFAVKDKQAFTNLVENLETNDGKAFMFENSRGEVGFAADGAIFGIKPDKSSRKISDATLKELKHELMMAGIDEIENFVGTSVDNWEKDTIDRFIDEVIEQMPNEELATFVDYYIGLNDPEPDEMETEMIHQIQSLIEPGHACIITTIGYENLKCLSADALIITQDKVESIILGDAALDFAKTMLGNENYSPDMAY